MGADVEAVACHHENSWTAVDIPCCKTVQWRFGIGRNIQNFHAVAVHDTQAEILGVPAFDNFYVQHCYQHSKTELAIFDDFVFENSGTVPVATDSFALDVVEVVYLDQD
mmetsp:Transcript_79852/g.156600  ORF Transcript_79852/g.156600 Transcript_79852/m.156600 type:complete len:109 (-) Transcript_79852:307-633(-)